MCIRDSWKVEQSNLKAEITKFTDYNIHRQFKLFCQLANLVVMLIKRLLKANIGTQSKVKNLRQQQKLDSSPDSKSAHTLR